MSHEHKEAWMMNGDCLELMHKIPDGSVDMVLCDLPYGITQCKWDSVIPFEPLWAHYKRLIKPNGAIVLFGSQPFTSALVMSNPKMFKYEWVWVKNKSTGHLSSKNRPLRKHESILVFSGTSYYPQGLVKKTTPIIRKRKSGNSGENYNSADKDSVQTHSNYPNSILEFGVKMRPVHPTQKPVALLEYLIKTYTNEGETVLDNTMGSGSTGVACVNTNRNFIGIEKEEKYFNIAQDRVFKTVSDFSGYNFKQKPRAKPHDNNEISF